MRIKMKILAIIPLDYIMGHLRYGHFEGSFEIPDEDIEEFIKQVHLIIFKDMKR